MKINISIDCTPDEARTFLGLPDVKPIQNAVMTEMQDKMVGAMQFMDPEAVLKAWFTGGTQGMEALQKIMFGIARGGRDPRDE